MLVKATNGHFLAPDIWHVHQIGDLYTFHHQDCFEGTQREIVREFCRLANSDLVTHVYPKPCPLRKAIIAIQLVMREQDLKCCIGSPTLLKAAQLFSDHFNPDGEHNIRGECMYGHFRIYIEDLTVERRDRCRECVLPILWRKQRRDLPMDAKRLIARAVWATRRSDQWEPDIAARKNRIKFDDVP